MILQLVFRGFEEIAPTVRIVHLPTSEIRDSHTVRTVSKAREEM